MRLLLTLLLALLAASAARADSWLPPSEETYLSSNGEWRLTVTPRGLKDSLSYFTDKVEGVELAGQAADETHATARARLERRTTTGWAQQWAAPLVNDVAPTSALVSNDGRYVVTFDNWHHVGVGDHVVVVYGPEGRLVRSLRIDEIVPPAYAAALPRSVSSLWWSGNHRLAPDGRHVLLAVRVPSEDLGSWEDSPTIPVRVLLDSGQPIPPSDRAWDRANAKAARIVGDQEAALAAHRAAMIAPLPAPRAKTAEAWRPYLYEALQRLASPAEIRGYDILLLTADEPDSETWMRTALTEAEPTRIVMMAAPGRTDRLAALVREIAAPLPAEAWKGMRIHLVIAPADAAPIAAALSARGADVRLLDPAVPIPQRPERLNGEDDRAEQDLLWRELEMPIDAASPAAPSESAPKAR